MIQVLHQHDTGRRNRDELSREKLGRRIRTDGEAILVVEPDPDRQYKLVKILAKIGRRVVATATSAGAVAFLNQYLASMVLIAEDLPKTQGRYLATSLRKTYPGLPVFILRENVGGHVVAAARLAGTPRSLKQPIYAEPSVEARLAVNQTAA